MPWPMVSDAGASRPRSPRPMMREASNRRARRTHAQRSRLPHPIFARVVLTENLAGLLGKSLVTGRRRLGRRPCGFGQSVLELCFLGTRMTADQSCEGLAFIEETISTGMPNASACICPAHRGIRRRYRIRTRCCLSPQRGPRVDWRIRAPIPPSGTCAASADYPVVACL